MLTDVLCTLRGKNFSNISINDKNDFVKLKCYIHLQNFSKHYNKVTDLQTG